ncbi:hypothetical protein [Sciscionella marina]|uniref:hypothetical protein n=1 Tax=Sciscionella marina TaxID=508770 RepID=UPI0003A5ED1C|nr:hypothetical protein [Sciscionella marina]
MNTAHLPRRLMAVTFGIAAAAAVLGAEPSAAATTPTNYDWAQRVLHEGHWPQSQDNLTVLTQWMASEQNDIGHWWTGGNPDHHHINPLNDGNGTGGGAGLGSYDNLRSAAYYAAKTLREGPDYRHITADLKASKPPGTTAKAIWTSPWAASHYGHGKHWYNTRVPEKAAPASDW